MKKYSLFRCISNFPLYSKFEKKCGHILAIFAGCLYTNTLLLVDHSLRVLCVIMGLAVEDKYWLGGEEDSFEDAHKRSNGYIDITNILYDSYTLL